MDGMATVEVRVWGDWACFTRPDMKAERVSYEVMTPSAARGILEAIFWKPEFYYQIKEIHVLKDIQYYSILRNEVNSKVSITRAASGEPYYADDDRAQRHTLALRDVSYLIKAEIRLKPNTENNSVKYREMFKRRVAKGQYYHHPYLGCREFAAAFSESDGSEKAIDRTGELGMMLFDLQYATDGTGTATPVFFNAQLDHGIMRVPEDLYRR